VIKCERGACVEKKGRVSAGGGRGPLAYGPGSVAGVGRNELLSHCLGRKKPARPIKIVIFSIYSNIFKKTRIDSIQGCGF
jgi:hypothetical protein